MAFFVVSAAVFVTTSIVEAPPSEESRVPADHTRETPDTLPPPSVPAAANGSTQPTEKRSASAEAPGDKSAWALRPFAIEAQFGVATPTGAIGITADYAIRPWFSVGCGIGTNFLGPEGGCGFRLRTVNSREHGYYAGFGVSGGPNEQTDSTRLGALAPFVGPLSSLREDLPPAPQQLSFAKWLDVEIGTETRYLSGLNWRLYAGLAFLLNPGDAKTPGAANTRDYYGVVPLNTAMLYVGCGIGAALGSSSPE